MATTPAQRFSETAAAYAATMAPSLRPIAETVVRRAALRPDERVLDIGTGTGIAAAAARGEGRDITGIDAAPGMLEIARREVPGVAFVEMDFGSLRFEDATFDVVLAAHALLFATDQVAVLSEWRRVTRPRGRLSLSVPGPREVTPTAIYGEIYERWGVGSAADYPMPAAMVERSREAGWTDVEVHADPTTAILLADEAAFRLWREIGSRGARSAELTPQQHQKLTDEMLAATPRSADGTLRVPFGAIYLTASR